MINKEALYSRAVSILKLASGEKFKKLQNKIEGENIKTKPGQTKHEAAAAIAASIGRRKLGKSNFQAKAAAGKRSK